MNLTHFTLFITVGKNYYLILNPSLYNMYVFGQFESNPGKTKLANIHTQQNRISVIACLP